MRTAVGLSLLAAGMLLLAAGLYLGDAVSHGIVHDAGADAREPPPWLTIAGMVTLACGMTVCPRARRTPAKAAAAPPATAEAPSRQEDAGMAAHPRAAGPG